MLTLIKKYILGVLLILPYQFTHAQNIPQKPYPPKIVNDFAKILSSNENNLLEKKLSSFNDSTSTQIAVVTIASLEGYDIASYSIELAGKWGIGRKGKDNGILVLIALQEKEARIEVGYGLEEFIPDITAKRIIERDLIPKFKNANYYEGLDNTTDTIIGLLSGKFKPEDLNTNNSKSKIKLIILIVCIILFFIFFSSRNKFNSGRGPITYGGGGYFFGGSNSGSESSGGGFGGFGGGSFGGGGASGKW